ncbi:membrane or secreted protein [Rhodoflexus sp.]
MMKHVKLWLTVIGMLTVGLVYAQDARLKGTWRVMNPQGIPAGAEVIYMMSDSYFVSAAFNEQDKQFIGVLGGTYRIAGDQFIGTLEFNSADSTLVGSNRSFTFSVAADGKQMNIITPEGSTETWTKIDDGATSLTGLWRFAGRVDAEGKETRSPRSARKTIKLLTGGYFVWAAINTDTKQFFGCGGGTYTVQDGKYTENIKFFSRDNSRVGASLTFDFEIKDKDWHHKGKNSRGEALYEIWAVD